MPLKSLSLRIFELIKELLFPFLRYIVANCFYFSSRSFWLISLLVKILPKSRSLIYLLPRHKYFVECLSNSLPIFWNHLITASVSNCQSLYTLASIHVFLRDPTFPKYFSSFLYSNRISTDLLLKNTTPISLIFFRNGYYPIANEVLNITQLYLDSCLRRPPGLYNESDHFSAIGHICLSGSLVKGVLSHIVEPNNIHLLYNFYPPANKLLCKMMIDKCSESGIKCTDFQDFGLAGDSHLAEPNLELWPSSNGYNSARNCYGLADYLYSKNFPPLLSLSSNQIDRANLLLSNALGLVNPRFVGIHLRKHNDKSRSLRNSQLSNLIPALDYMLSRNYTPFLLGDFHGQLPARLKNLVPDMRILKKNLSSDQYDLIQAYIWSQSYFFIGNLSGGTFPPGLFGTRVLWFDLYPISHFRPPSANDTFIFKQVYSRSLSRFLKFEEYFALEYSDSQLENPSHLEQNGYIVKINSSLDILNAVENMFEQHLHATSEAQEKISSYYSLNGFKYGAKIDSSFLEKYSSTLFG